MFTTKITHKLPGVPKLSYYVLRVFNEQGEVTAVHTGKSLSYILKIQKRYIKEAPKKLFGDTSPF